MIVKSVLSVYVVMLFTISENDISAGRNDSNFKFEMKKLELMSRYSSRYCSNEKSFGLKCNAL